MGTAHSTRHTLSHFQQKIHTLSSYYHLFFSHFIKDIEEVMISSLLQGFKRMVMILYYLYDKYHCLDFGFCQDERYLEEKKHPHMFRSIEMLLFLIEIIALIFERNALMFAWKPMIIIKSKSHLLLFYNYSNWKWYFVTWNKFSIFWFLIYDMFLYTILVYS